MRSADIQQFAAEVRLPKCDRLFRAAISGYCSLTRPCGRDAAQLDDLALPLLPLVSEESKRFGAAALSESLPAPPALLRRLADHPVSVSAPLLIRSRALADIDLIGLIGRHGLEHAGAIARRPGLNPNIAALVRALGIMPEAEPAPARAAEEAHVDEGPEPIKASDSQAEHETRERLRTMMRPASTPVAPSARQPARLDWVAAHAAYPRLVASGLTGVSELFHTAIADAFDMSFEGAHRLAEADEGKRLPVALKAAGLTVAEAFLVAALAFPPRFASTAAIRAFVEAFRRIDVDEARGNVSAWQAQAPQTIPEPAVPQAANAEYATTSRAVAKAGLLKAS